MSHIRKPSNMNFAYVNRICPNKLTLTTGGCMGYMDEIKLTGGQVALRCPLCGYTKIIEKFKITPN